MFKNQDNEWYREQGERIAKIETNVDNISKNVAEIKRLVLDHQIGHSKN